jgi:hypothetical protein
MSIQSDVISALSTVAGGNVRANYAEKTITPPLVVVRRVAYEPVMKLTGPAGFAKSTFMFDCWGKKASGSTAKAASLALADDVKAAMAAQPLTFIRYQEAVDGEQVDIATLEQMEPLQYSFWHDD